MQGHFGWWLLITFCSLFDLFFSVAIVVCKSFVFWVSPAVLIIQVFELLDNCTKKGQTKVFSLSLGFFGWQWPKPKSRFKLWQSQTFAFCIIQQKWWGPCDICLKALDSSWWVDLELGLFCQTKKQSPFRLLFLIKFLFIIHKYL